MPILFMFSRRSNALRRVCYYNNPSQTMKQSVKFLNEKVQVVEAAKSNSSGSNYSIKKPNFDFFCKQS